MLDIEVFWDVKPGKELLTFRRIGASSSPETKSWPLFDPEDYLLIGPNGVISHKASIIIVRKVTVCYVGSVLL